MTPPSATPQLPTGIVDYPVDDMTITVEAQLTCADLAKVLAQHRQQLPIDPVDGSQTIGELVTHDIAGPRQYGRGTLRDYVIGIEALDGRGRRFHAGGRVVKNVAGYDLCRLLIGSRGLLGTVTQVTFKVSPLPPASSLLAASFATPGQLSHALEILNTSASSPVILDVLNDFAAHELCTGPLAEFLPHHSTPTHDVTHLLIGFEGPPDACRWQLDAAVAELTASARLLHPITAPNALALWCSVAQQHSVPSPSHSWLSRLTLLPSRVPDALHNASAHNCAVFGRAGNGVLFVRSAGQHQADERAVLASLGRFIAPPAGSILVLRGNPQFNTPSSAPVAQLSNALQTALAAPASN
jgi:glycolate oxidase FAD binding subunit